MASSLRTQIFLLSLILFSILAAAEAGGEVQIETSMIPNLPVDRCNGSIGDCLLDEEFEMGSESSRRILASKDYISRNAESHSGRPAPMSPKLGQSYKNCANQYVCPNKP